jgi:cbb3-type cytochrome oxidase subunit 3
MNYHAFFNQLALIIFGTFYAAAIAWTFRKGSKKLYRKISEEVLHD